MSEETKEAPVIKAGDTEYKIGRFKGFKAFRIGRMLTSMGEIGPEIATKVSEFVVKYREYNIDVIERATLEFRYPTEAAGVSDKAWEESGGVIKLANDPSQAEILAVVFPTAFELAGDKVVDLLAWIVADDAELERKDNEGEEAIQEYIKGLRRTLLFRCDVDELFDLAAAARDVLADQMAGKGEQARSLLALVGLGEDEGEEQSKEEPETEDEEPKIASPEFESEQKGETPSTPESPTTSQRPDSSTDSPPPTDGPEEKSSTERDGELSPSTSG